MALISVQEGRKHLSTSSYIYFDNAARNTFCPNQPDSWPVVTYDTCFLITNTVALGIDASLE